MGQEADAQPGTVFDGVSRAEFQQQARKVFGPWGDKAAPMILEAYNASL